MDVYTTSFCLPHCAAHQELEDPTPSFELPRDVAAAAAANNHPGANAHSQQQSSFIQGGGGSSRIPSGDMANAASAALNGKRSTSSIASLGHTMTSSSSLTGGDGSTAPSSAAQSQIGAPGMVAAASSSASTRHAGSDAGRDTAAARRAEQDMSEQMQRLCMEAMSNYQCTVTCSLLEAGKGYNFHLSGGYQQVMGARGFVLRGSPFKKKSVVKVPRSEVLDAKENVKTEMRRKLDEIAALTKAHLAIVGQVSGTIGFGLETERNVEIVITGLYESVEQARVRLLVLLDELVRPNSGVTKNATDLLFCRAAFTQTFAKSITSCTTSSQVANVP